MPTTVRKLKANATPTKATPPTSPAKAVTTKPVTKAAAAAAPAKTKPVAPVPQKPVAAPEPEPVEIEQDQEIVYEEQPQEEVLTDTTAASDIDEGLIHTPAIKRDPPKPTAHIATITAFERADYDSGAVSATFRLVFEDNDKEDRLNVWLLPLFVTNFLEVMQEPEKYLSDVPEEGKSLSQLQRYLSDIASGDCSAKMQKYLRIASSQGHTRDALGIEALPDSIDSWFEILGSIFVGVKVIALCAPDRKSDNPEFAHILRVHSMLDPSILENADQKVLKRYEGKKGYVFAWE